MNFSLKSNKEVDQLFNDEGPNRGLHPTTCMKKSTHSLIRSTKSNKIIYARDFILTVLTLIVYLHSFAIFIETNSPYVHQNDNLDKTSTSLKNQNADHLTEMYRYNIQPIVNPSMRKLKLSTTRVKLRSIHAPTLRFLVDQPFGDQANDASRQFDGFRRQNGKKQMAPAYTIWPSFEVNHLARVEENSIYKSPSTRVPRGRGQRKVRESSALPIRRVGQGRHSRNVLTDQSLDTRSTMADAAKQDATNQATSDDYESTDGSDSKIDSTPDEAIKPGTNDSSDESPEEDDTTDIDRIDTSNDDETKRSQIKSFSLSGKAEPLQAETNRMFDSPVYPPGDAERLYSDALLVYVKDFNNNISR